MSERLSVDEPAALLPFLESRLSGWGRGTVKGRLRSGCVRVNGEPVTRHDHSLVPGDQVEVRVAGKGNARHGRSPSLPTLPALHVDDDLVAIDKPAGLLSVATARERARTALAILRESLSAPRHPAHLWPVHRLDRETSGVLLFARSPTMRDRVQARWGSAIKTYLAIVEGHPEPAEGVVSQPLWEDRSLNVRVGSRAGARDARTRYATLRAGHRRTLLEIHLDSGRRHQVRVHLAWLGHPVVGDGRYGAAGPRLGLHALRLELAHPRDGRALSLAAPPPGDFSALLRGAPT